eukprot:3900883-Pyramimonas_sp.AAC.1
MNCSSTLTTPCCHRSAHVRPRCVQRPRVQAGGSGTCRTSSRAGSPSTFTIGRGRRCAGA